MEVIAFAWLLIGGLLEPVWLIALKRSNGLKDRKWGVTAIVLAIASPFFLSLAMRDIPMGTAYAIWTGIGVIGALAAGLLIYDEKVDRAKMLFVSMILIGIVGLAIGGI